MTGKFELIQAADGKFHYNLKASNGRVILTSHHYQWKAKAEADIALVRQCCTNDASFQHKRSKIHEPYFILIAPDGHLLGQSEMYSTSGAMKKGIASVKTHAVVASIINLNPSQMASA